MRTPPQPPTKYRPEIRQELYTDLIRTYTDYPVVHFPNVAGRAAQKLADDYLSHYVADEIGTGLDEMIKPFKGVRRVRMEINLHLGVRKLLANCPAALWPHILRTAFCKMLGDHLDDFLNTLLILETDASSEKRHAADRYGLRLPLKPMPDPSWSVDSPIARRLGTLE